MNRRFFSIRMVAILVAALLAAVPLAAGDGSSPLAAASYLGGSVISIPAYANGRLDLNDQSTLQFHYGEQSEKWPYSSIVGLTLEKPGPRSTWKKVASFGVLALPMLSDNGVRELTIHYRNEDGLTSSVVFEMPARGRVSFCAGTRTAHLQAAGDAADERGKDQSEEGIRKAGRKPPRHDGRNVVGRSVLEDAPQRQSMEQEGARTAER